jgi:hypothetical protein
MGKSKTLRSLFRRWGRQQPHDGLAGVAEPTPEVHLVSDCERYGHQWTRHPCHPDCRSCYRCGEHQLGETDEALALRTLDQQDAAWADAPPALDDPDT